MRVSENDIRLYPPMAATLARCYSDKSALTEIQIRHPVLLFGCHNLPVCSDKLNDLCTNKKSSCSDICCNNLSPSNFRAEKASAYKHLFYLWKYNVVPLLLLHNASLDQREQLKSKMQRSEKIRKGW